MFMLSVHVEDTETIDSEFLEALREETKILEERVNRCKSRIVMMTSFDITQPRPVPIETSSQSAEVIVNQVDIGCDKALYQLKNI